jgi:hypothetical protein
MGKLSVAAWAVALVLAAAPSTATGQETCNQVLPSDFRRIITETGQEMMYYRDPVRMICTSGVRIEADSAVMNRTANTLEMVGRVLYRDGERQLTSEWARYLGHSDELFARGNVVLTDLADGSVIRGNEFEYQRPTPERPESRMLMWGGRPHAELNRAAADGAEAGSPVRVRADRLELINETEFLAHTNVELERDDLRGAADAVRFDEVADRMTLTGNAHVETDAYRLEGDQINALMFGEALREVLSQGSARLVGEDLTVSARTIRIGFVDGDPERVEAWNPRPVADEDAAPAAGAQRAVAVSRDFRLRADSIDARSIEGRLREVHAVGRAYGEREADTVSVQLPDVIARDWIQGDTIIGYFADAVTVPADAPPIDPEDNSGLEPDPELVLERVEVIGGSSDALSLYRSEAAGDEPRPAVNFMRATRITLFMSDGEVTRVEAEGPLEGVHLDPTQDDSPPPAPAARTTAARRP